MSYASTIRENLKEVEKVIGRELTPEEKVRIEEIFRTIWKGAINYDSVWDSD
jgi:hypothetical protein